MQNKHVYKARRDKLFDKLNSGIVIVPTTNEIIRNQDSTFQYRFDSHFYYLTGFNEPEAVLVLDLNNKKSILFCREKNIEREIWDGFRYGVEGSKEVFGFDETYSINQFNEKLLDYLNNAQSLYYTIGYNSNYDQVIISKLNEVRKMFRSGAKAPFAIYDINQIIAELRVIKDSYDIDMLTQACKISAMAHLEAMKSAKSASYEYQLEAKILETFYKHGARYPSYTPIVGGGANACILHYVENNQKLKDGDLVLIDAGCEYMGYAGDITRTFPINGKFSKAQQAIYEIVLEANKQAINELKIGSPWNSFSDKAVEVLVQGLIDLGLLKGSIEDNIANQSYRQFYMHRIGHWLGLDVHDVGSYKTDDGNWRLFEPGMCTTVEPGLYISPAANVPEQYWNIGIRIEDNILITENGILNLTVMAPKEVKDIEHYINS